ncbi:non-ribosomal peptide synthetase/MFS transporter [Embleya scabrispora]|uniref:non-ribosomal peptide synthetase/MFS transporter n=1 Tax=Embleya scabrispora TaxID=159449 RepID=UPI00037559AF|nr:non-ribosomal peptide synthetase/MFS transporter [Embleya scabrispora]MYS82707.1 non-ribosomal peptide synthetase [Streptomyces sp. SID5474]
MTPTPAPPSRPGELSAAKRTLLEQRLRRSTTTAPASIPRLPDGARVPLSSAQIPLWFMENLTPGTAAYTIPIALRLRGRLDEDALERALNALLSRHDSLRTTFGTSADGGPVATVHPPMPITVARHSPAEDLDAEARERWASALVGAEFARPFHLEIPPLMRAALVRLDREDTVLVVVLHHLVGDGWSVHLLVNELMSDYDAFTAGLESPVPEPTVRYGDYAAWQQQRLAGPEGERAARYWRDRLAGLGTLALPTDRPRPARQTFGGDAHGFTLDAELASGISELGRAHGATSYMTLLAAWQAVLSRHGGQDDFAVGSPIAGRPHPDLEPMIGMFVNMLAMRAPLAGDPTFAELLGRVRESCLDAYAHQDLPFDQVVRDQNVTRDVSRTPLFQVTFALQNYERGERGFTGLGHDWFSGDSRVTRFDLSLFVFEAGTGMNGLLTYNTDLFDASTVARLAGHLTTLLRAVVADPHTPLSRIDLLEPQERARLVTGWNDTARPMPEHRTLTAAIEAQVASDPRAPAVTHEGRTLDYGELDARADRLARYLRGRGVGPETPVALCLEQSLDLAVAVLAVLKAGGAYLPLDPEQPVERLAFMLADADVRVLVTDTALRERTAGHTGTFILLDRERAAIDACDQVPDQESDPGRSPDAAESGNLAYVIYTSGSTGRPKGVAVQHREALAYLDGVRERFEVVPGSVHGLAQSLSFDFAITALYLAWTTGGELHLIPARLSGAEFADHLNRHPVDYLKMTPSHLAGLAAEAGAERLLPRRLLILGGEGSSWEWARDLAALGRCAVVNHYGPTETTVGVTTYRVRPQDVPVSTVTPIGRPLPNARVYLLDAHLQPVPIGVTGEIHIGGERLARGYLGQPGATADRFVPDPFGPPGARLYRTGDLGRYLPGGDVEFLGRSDQQVKIRGYRVEPAEIEKALRAQPAVGQVVVDARGPAGAQRLIAYLVPAEEHPGEPPAGADLRRELLVRLPEYMVPSRFVWLDRLPLKAHGKVDRALLPEPDAGVGADCGERVAPAGATEEALVEIWCAVLDLAPVGVTDDFFELGGHSLLAMQVLARLRKVLPPGSRQVSLLELFKHRTVRELAALIDRPAGEDEPRSLLHELTRPVPAGRQVLSLVCVPYGGGSAVVYQPLADALPAGHSLYSVAIPGHDLSMPEAPRPIEEVARECADEILARVEGPLALYGHCGVGSALTAQIAHLLEESGRRLEAVYLGAIFPFARPEGGMLGALSRFAGLERLRGDRVHLNWLTSMGADLGDLDEEQVTFIIRNMRKDGRTSEEYFTRRMAEGMRPLAAPVISVIGERDPSTEFYQERYREWHFMADATALVVIDEAGHYFLRYRADELAEIVTATHEAMARERTEPLTRTARGQDAGWWLEGVSGGTGTDAGAGVAGVGSATVDAEPARTPAVRPSMGRFMAVALGQLASITGSALTEFAIPIWIYLRTDSLTQFALFSVLALVPGIVVAPLAGAVVDRNSRRTVMLAADCAAGAVQVVMAVLLWSGHLGVGAVYGLLVVLSVTATFQRLAYNSAVPQLVPKRYLGHANGIVQTSTGLAQLVVPLIAVALLASIGLGGILLIDITTFVIAVTVVAFVPFPDTMAQTRRESLAKEIANGVRYSMGHPGFRTMLLYFALLNVFLAPMLVLMTPLVLSFGSVHTAGAVGVAAGAGALLGGLAMGVWGGPRHHRMRGILLATVLIAVFAFVAGLRPSPVPVGIGFFGVFFGLSLLNGIYATIIQVKVPQRFHGRVIALNTMVAWSTLPLGFGVIAPLAVHLLEPLFSPGGALASSVGRVIGVGDGRGTGFLYLLCASAMIVLALASFRHRVIAGFDDEVPDAMPDDLIGIEERRKKRADAATTPQPPLARKLPEPEPESELEKV